MDKTLEDILRANRVYAAGFGSRGGLAAAPRLRCAILTCMDARLDPARFAGLAEGDAHVIRNAGGRATDDAIRSLVVSHKLLGTRLWLVVHHTDCGMATFDNGVMGDLLAGSLNTAVRRDGVWRNVDEEGGTVEGRFCEWHAFGDLRRSVTDDVERIRCHPMVSKKVSVFGFVYDCGSGALEGVTGG